MMVVKLKIRRFMCCYSANFSETTTSPMNRTYVFQRSLFEEKQQNTYGSYYMNLLWKDVGLNRVKLQDNVAALTNAEQR